LYSCLKENVREMERCPDCDGTGKKTLHTLAGSPVVKCARCKGVGFRPKKIQFKGYWYDPDY
jgi:hypothetical protein